MASERYKSRLNWAALAVSLFPIVVEVNEIIRRREGSDYESIKGTGWNLEFGIAICLVFIRFVSISGLKIVQKWIYYEGVLVYCICKVLHSQPKYTPAWLMGVASVFHIQASYYPNLLLIISKYLITCSFCLQAGLPFQNPYPFILTLLLIIYNYLNSQHLSSRYQDLFTDHIETQQQFKATLDAVNVGIVAIDSSHKPVIVNDCLMRFFNCNRPDEIFPIISQLEFRSRADKYIRWVESDRLVDNFHYFMRLVNRSSTLGIVSYASKAIEIGVSRISYKKSTAILVTARDLTEHLELHKQRSESNFKSVILRSVSHELRTPTNGILGMIELIKSEAVALSPENEYRLDIASKSCKHLLFLINDLVDFSQIVAGTFKLRFMNFELKDLLQECMSLIEVGASHRNIHLEINISHDIPQIINSEPNRLSQILLNLLSNSLKFTERGSITITAKLEKRNNILFIVKDTGIGIPQAHQNQLFKAFSKLDDELTSRLNPTGCGLGLHISNMLVQYLGGEPIQLSSQEGQGSEFYFKLPLHEIPSVSSTADSLMCEQVSVRLPQSMTIFHRNPFLTSISECKSILVVDDSDFNRIVMCRILQSLGATTAEAMNGKAALSYVNLHKHHSGCLKMIFIDYEMPDLNGCQVSRQISEMSDLNPKPLLILCTAYSDQQTLKRCREAGMTGFIKKPCSISDLKEVLSDSVSRNGVI